MRLLEVLLNIVKTRSPKKYRHHNVSSFKKMLQVPVFATEDYKRTTYSRLKASGILRKPIQTEAIARHDPGCQKNTWSAKTHQHDSGTAIGYGLDDKRVGVRVPVGARIYTSPCRPDPRPKRVLGAPSPGLKWLGDEDDHSSPTTAEVKKMWLYTPTSQ
jgi:hypothetical protein